MKLGVPSPDSSKEQLQALTSHRGAEARPLSVSELSARIRGLLEGNLDRILVAGEVTGLRTAGSGHVYFSLKDAGALIACVLWARDAGRQKAIPKDGEEAEVEGRIGVYEPRGQYQLIATSVRPAGLGRLHAEFLRLKERLERAGLFDPARKRPLPRTPARIGIVTSPTGAALRDILAVLNRRAPGISVWIWPARVQGEGAAREIQQGVEALGQCSWPEVIIVGRGGGSMEDLWAFNDEKLAMAISQCPIPVISAVGHEIDYTIADFVADLRAPTPSAAAEIVAQSSAELLRELTHLRRRLDQALTIRMEQVRRRLGLRDRLGPALQNRLGLLKLRLEQTVSRPAFERPLDRIDRIRQQIDDLRGRIQRTLLQMADKTSRRLQAASFALYARGSGIIQHLGNQLEKLQLRMNQTLMSRLHEGQSRLRGLDNQIRALDPTSILQRGYAVVHQIDGRAVRQPTQVRAGEELRILVAGGEFRARAKMKGLAPRTSAANPRTPMQKNKSNKRPKTGNEDPDLFGLEED